MLRIKEKMLKDIFAEDQLEKQMGDSKRIVNNSPKLSVMVES
jgi:hypothetical protein